MTVRPERAKQREQRPRIRPEPVPAISPRARRRSERAATCALWLLGLAPVVMLPGLYDRWGWPVLVCASLAALCAVAAPARGFLPRWFVIACAITLFVLVIASLTGDAPIAQLFGRAPRYEGVPVWLTLFATAWTAARVLDFSDRNRRESIGDAWSLAATLLGGLSLLEAVGLRPLATDVDRPGSLAGNATDQGLLGVAFAVLLGAGILGDLRRGAHLRHWHVVGFVSALAAVATSASRAAYLGLFVATVALAIVHLRASRHRRRDALVLLGGTAALVLGAAVVPAVRERAFFTPDSLASSTIGDRWAIWRLAASVVAARPWLGVGPSGFEDAAPLHFGDEWFQRAEVGSVLDSPHNIIVQAAIAAGVPGLCGALALLAAVVIAAGVRMRVADGARRDELTGALVAMAAVGIGMLTHVSSPKTTVLLVTLIGVLVTRPLTPVGEPAARRSRLSALWRKGAQAGLLVVWVGLLSLWTCADAFVLTGVNAAARGQIDHASADFTAAARLRPWDADIPLRAAEALGGALDDGHTEAASPALDWGRQAVARLPESARSHQAMGMISQSNGDLDAAVDQLTVAVELSPADPRMHHELGVALAAAGDLPTARTQLERAGLLAPDSVSTWMALEQVCLQLGDPDCADEAHRSADVADG